MASEDTSPTVMLAVDGSWQAEAAFDWYIDNAHQPSHRLVVVHCVVPPTVYGTIDHYIYDDMYDELVGKGRNIQFKYSALFKEHGVKGTFTSAIHNDAANWIVQKAAEVKPVLIVMGSRGLGTVRRTLLGSTSGYVLHHAHCPVAVCPATKHSHEQQQA